MHFLLLFMVVSDSLLIGNDPVKRFTPADYNASFQNFALLQLDDGRLLAANTSGVLVYDGATWSLVPLPNSKMARSLAIGHDGRIWVGSDGGIGILEPDSEEGFRYVEVESGVNGVVLSITSDMDATYFQATEHVWMWKNGKLGRLDVQNDGVDVRFEGMRIVAILPDSGATQIVITRENGWYRLDPTQPDIIPIDIQVPETYSAKRLRDGTLAIGTIRNGLHLVSPDFKTSTLPGQEIGVHLDAIWSILEDREGHVWLATDRGLVQVYRYPDMDMWDSRSGLIGNIQSVRRFQNRLFVGTSMGLFVQDDDGFRSVSGMEQPVWDMMERSGDLWLATSDGIRIWDGQRIIRHPVSEPTYVLHSDVNDPNRIWAGIAEGLLVIQSNSAGRRIPGLTLDVRGLTQEPDGTIWAGTSRGGVVRVDTDGLATFYLESVGDTRVARWNGSIVASTPNGLRTWNQDKMMFESMGGGDASGVYRMRTQADSILWVVRFQDAQSWVEQITKQGTKSKPYRRLPNRGMLHLYPDGDQIWVGTTSGLYRVDRSIAMPITVPFEIAIRTIQTGSVTRIRFSAAWFEDPASVRYRFRLVGDTEWSEWSTATEAVFVDLWEGGYRFEAEAMNKYDIHSLSEPVEFTILPPIHRTPLAYLLYVVLLVGIVWSGRWGTRAYSRQRTERLETLVRERTRQVNRQKEELIGANRSLTSMIEQKNTILSIAAHDLKNPLATVQGFSELIAMSLDDLEANLNDHRTNLREYLTYVRQASTDMFLIINDLLDTAVAQNGAISMVPRAFPLTDMAFTIASTYRPVAEKKGVHLSADIPSDSMVAMADPDRMQEVFLNLVSNAVKYSRVGGTVRVSLLRAERNELHCIGFRVQDEGPGFTEEDRDKMFGLFSRLSALPTAGERSNGIGLYIVKQFTELNNGTVDLQTVVGQGSTFTIWIPAAEA